MCCLGATMATLDSPRLSFFHVSPSSNPPLLSSARSKLPISIFTPKLSLKCHLPLLPISRKHPPFSSSSSSSAAVEEEEVSAEEEEEEEEEEGKLGETQKETVTKKKRVYVLNLPWSFSADDLKNIFAQCGTVEDAEIIRRKKDGKSRGYAFVTMASTEDAQAVIEKYNSYELMGRIIRVEFAKDVKKSSPPTPTPGEKPSKLYVSNLQWKVRANNLREFFGAEFNPISTRVVFESPSGRSAGYGFVTFASKKEAESAISALDGKELLGRPITLMFSERKEGKTETEEENASNKQPVES